MLPLPRARFSFLTTFLTLTFAVGVANSQKDSTTAQCEPWCQNTEAHIKYCKCSACSFAGKHAVGEACSFADVYAIPSPPTAPAWPLFLPW